MKSFAALSLLAAAAVAQKCDLDCDYGYVTDYDTCTCVWLPYMVLAAAADAKKCDLICPMNYSIDLDACACVEKKYMECHPDYGNDCV